MCGTLSERRGTMAFEDPAKLKIDLVVGDEKSDQAQVESQPADLEPNSESLQTKAASLTDEVECQTASAEGSLTPWKNRFRHEKTKGRKKYIKTPTFEVGTISLSVAMLATSVIALGNSPHQFSSAPSTLTLLTMMSPIILGCAVYPLFLARLCRLLSSLRVKLPTKQAFAPALIACTVVTWHFFLSIDAACIAFIYRWIRSAESSLGHEHTAQAMAALAGGGAIIVILNLLLLLIASMFVFKKFFQWIDEETFKVHGVSLGVKKSGFYGFVTGAIFGLCGTYLELAVGGPSFSQVVAITSLIWSLGILCCCRYFSAQESLPGKDN